MVRYLMSRGVQMILTLWIVSIVGFVIIQLPPGDYLTILEQQLLDQRYTDEQIEAQLSYLRELYALGEPMHIQYLRWISGVLRGSLGYSFALGREVNELVGDRLGISIAISLTAMLLTIVISWPVGVLSAVRQYSLLDNVFTVISFVGAGLPSMLLALILMFVAAVVLHVKGIGTLFSSEYVAAPWSLGKVLDLIKHLWLPALIVGVTSTASGIRVVRARMLDTLGEPFIQTARMKGLSERAVIWRHAFRVVLNPLVSSLGMSLPGLLSGETIMSMVLGLATVGPLLVSALRSEDIYMAGSILVIMTSALVFGNFVADMVLAWLDPRIRLG